jgi:hypothetical protein
VHEVKSGLIAASQAQADTVNRRDQRFKIHSQDEHQERETITAPPIESGADAWQ